MDKDTRDAPLPNWVYNELMQRTKFLHGTISREARQWLWAHGYMKKNGVLTDRCVELVKTEAEVCDVRIALTMAKDFDAG